jgi:hypothetical protein
MKAKSACDHSAGGSHGELGCRSHKGRERGPAATGQRAIGAVEEHYNNDGQLDWSTRHCHGDKHYEPRIPRYPGGNINNLDTLMGVTCDAMRVKEVGISPSDLILKAGCRRDW